MPCQKVLALVRSTNKSVPDPSVKMAEGTFKLITPGVECVLASDDAHLASNKFTLSATCTIDELPSYRLDPPRGKAQHALVTITTKMADPFVVENVQLLDDESTAKAKESLKRLQYLGMHLHVRDKKRLVTWTDEQSPIGAKKKPHSRPQCHGCCRGPSCTRASDGCLSSRQLHASGASSLPVPDSGSVFEAFCAKHVDPLNAQYCL
jgi:hypothetical protein